MTTPTEVANLALGEVGQRISINAFSDGSPAANAAKLFYTPKMQMLMRTANWAFARGQIALTLWAQASDTNPPPQPWLYSYLYPSDALKLRFLQPTLNLAPPGIPLTTGPGGNFASYPGIPTAIPFIEGTSFDTSRNPIRVVLTQIPAAQAVYTRDLTQTPDLWDPLFLSAATALLASYFINALARDKVQAQQQISMAKSLIDQARLVDGNEAITNIDHTPDWIRARNAWGGPWSGSPASFVGGPLIGGWDSCAFPDGTAY